MGEVFDLEGQKSQLTDLVENPADDFFGGLFFDDFARLLRVDESPAVLIQANAFDNIVENPEFSGHGEVEKATPFQVILIFCILWDTEADSE